MTPVEESEAVMDDGDWDEGDIGVGDEDSAARRVRSRSAACLT